MIAGQIKISSWKRNAAGWRICLMVLLNLSMLSPASAQEQSNFTQFFLNPYLLNASYAGFDGQPSASLFYHNQWMNIEGAPTITNLSLHAPVTSRLSAGVNVTNDAKGFFNNTVLLFSVAYQVPIRDDAFVRFGISAGGSWNTVDLKKLEVMNDPALSDMLEKNASLAGNAGVSLHVRRFHFGVAMPTIFSPSYVSQDAFNVKEVKPFQAIILNASNRFYFNDNKNIFEPYLIYRINSVLPSQFEFAGVVHLNHVIWVGGSFKQDFGISALGGVKLKNMLAIGASYSIRNSGINELNSPGFEISLNYLFGLRKKGTAIYSFVNAVKEKEKKPARVDQGAMASKRQQAEEAQGKKAEQQDKIRQTQLDQKTHAAGQARVKKEAAEKKKLDSQAKLKQDTEEKNRLVQESKLKQEEAAEKNLLAEQARAQALEEQKKKSEAQAVLDQAPARQQEIDAQAKLKQEADEKTRVAQEAKLRKEEAATKNQQAEQVRLQAAAEQKKKSEEQAKIDQEAERQKQLEAKAKEVRDLLARQQSEARAKAEQEAIDKKKYENEQEKISAKERTKQLESETPVVREEFAKQAPPPADNVPAEIQRKYEQDQLKRLETAAEDPTQAVEGTLETASVARHEFVKHGNHPQELDISEYVIAGAFKSVENAKQFSDGLINLNFQAQYGYLTEKGLWYVYLLKTSDPAKATAEQLRVGKMFLLRDAWLLTVQP